MIQQINEDKRQRRIEAIVLLIGTILIAEIWSNFSFPDMWLTLELLVDVALMVLAWTLFFTRFGTYTFRAYITFGMIQISLFLYILHVERIVASISFILVFNLLITLYTLPHMIYITTITYTLEVMYHIVIKKSLHLSFDLDGMRLLSQILSVYFIQFMIFYLIHRQAEIERIKDERIEELKGAEQSKDDFLANVSHEIRTPIHAINGLCTLLLQDKLTRELHEKVSNIQAEGQNLLTVVSDILDFSELQSGHMELVEDEYSIALMVNDIINMSAAANMDKNLDMLVDLDPQMPCGLVGDEQKIQRVTMNLIKNALKFTNEGGFSVHFSFRKEDYGINLNVEVRDTGIGMDSKSLEKLFSMFSQIDSKRNRQEGGIGLGLAISKMLVTQMGGFISVKSELGRGTQIQFSIPQKVSDWEPVAKVDHPIKLNTAVYINLEQFSVIDIRDEYSTLIGRIVKILGVSCIVCRNLAELKRRVEREYLTHVFISMVEYEEDTKFFDQLSEQVKILVVLDKRDEERIKNDRLLRIYKPFYVVPIVMALNGDVESWGVDMSKNRYDGFVTKDAKVLIVDDNRMNLKVLEGLLKNYDIQVVTATSGPEALERIETKDFDFVFMDHMMPEMDGIETFKRIRSRSGNYYSNVPVIMLTANAVSGMREIFLAEGFNEFAAKPIESSALERIIKKFLPPSKIIPKSRSVESADTRTDSAGEKVPADTGENAAKTNAQTGDGDGLGGLDTQMGIMYCGSPEGYYDILQMYYDEGDENRAKIEKFFSEKNWKEYQILVHALKSSMKSIGAVGLSEQAKKLESACKTGDIEYILSAHGTVMKEYERIIHIIAGSPRIKKKDASSTSSLPAEENPHIGETQPLTQEVLQPELSEEEMNQRLQNFEDAAFSFDKEQMTAVLDELSAWSFCGKNTAGSLKPIYKKVEMDDFMSACDTLMKLRDKWNRN